LSKQEKYPQAAAAYKKALALNPKLPGIELNLGLAEFKQGNFTGAIAPLRAASTEGGANREQARFLLGMSYYGAQHYAEAVKILRPVSDAQPDNTDLRQVVAQSCLHIKENACAMEEFRQLLEKNPNSAATHVLMGQALDGLNREGEAIAEFQAALKIAPKEPDLHFGLGYLYWKSHKYDDAKREFESELAIDPNHRQALTYLGDTELERNNSARAAELLDRATAGGKGLRLAYLDLGTIHMQQKQYEAAVSDLQHAIDLDPSQPDAHYRVARAYQELGKHADAEKEFAKSRALHQKADQGMVSKAGSKAE
jgi:tetratricopeptide (TPR) repeat protein